MLWLWNRFLRLDICWVSVGFLGESVSFLVLKVIVIGEIGGVWYLGIYVF